MKPIDKYGNPICGKTWAIISTYGAILLQAGYREAREKQRAWPRVPPLPGRPAGGAGRPRLVGEPAPGEVWMMRTRRG